MPVHSVSLLNRASLTRGDQVLLLVFGTTGKHPDNEVLMHLQGYLIATQKTITNEQKAKERALPQKKKKSILPVYSPQKENNISPFADGYCCVRSLERLTNKLYCSNLHTY